MISHCEGSVVEEVESTTDTQYVMSGSLLGISKEKGADQSTKIVVVSRVTVRGLTAGNNPVR